MGVWCVCVWGGGYNQARLYMCVENVRETSCTLVMELTCTPMLISPSPPLPPIVIFPASLPPCYIFKNGSVTSLLLPSPRLHLHLCFPFALLSLSHSPLFPNLISRTRGVCLETDVAARLLAEKCEIPSSRVDMGLMSSEVCVSICLPRQFHLHRPVV